ncbi:C4-type zinc ribbon domain-containing protein [Pelagicoccus sp. SDUM812005]|uniref:zinc ribbon domain-containing protein n=1 Tax=Pelagicoccus sp. SDUM812005 TaxID=3041257 RepID=UPI00280C776C|nr:C4-type zinc ribbon domain-containing protein [Pelagicoccus sp. SDUM812005]MDQ8183405.1 C4-type zinc ribbon domain-containing protein [Pelagicoccus sp. SDUM812005]
MVSDALTKMLILQDRDMKLQQVEDALQTIPQDRRAAEARIAQIKADVEAARRRIKELETKGKTIETEMASIEAQIVKYKNQQLQVKKNEEYQALIHEIENAGKKISDLESDELEVLYELDEERKRFAEAEAKSRDEIALEEKAIARLNEREGEVRGELEAAREAKAKADAELDNPSRSKYTQVARGLKFPVIVELVGTSCKGCHMKVSNAILSEVKAAKEITTCDNCGRVLYYAD